MLDVDDLNLTAGPGAVHSVSGRSGLSTLIDARTVGFLLLCGAAIGVARPFVSNQNAHLLHGVGPLRRSLDGDFVLSATDPFPLFSRVIQVIDRVGGRVGLMLVLYAAAVTAATGLYLIGVAILQRLGRGPSTALVATLLVCASYPLLTLMSDAGDLTPFGGFGGQYLFIGAGYLQPCTAGALVLLAIGIAGLTPSTRARSTLAIVLVASACALHPTYCAPVLVGLAAIVLADVSTGRGFARVPLVGVALGVTAVLVFVTNPVARSFLDGRSGSSDANAFLAFERIPHHTLWTHWSVLDLWLLGFILVASLVARVLTRSWWLSISLLSATAVGLVAAVVVERTRNVSLAMAFPWRVSVFVVPVASMVVAVALVQWLRQRVKNRTSATAILVGVCCVVSLVGGYAISARSSDPALDPGVEAVRAAHTTGTGLIPIGEQNVRLNAAVPVFADWKTHPYKAADVEEWLRRIELVNRAWLDPQVFCSVVDTEAIGWVLAPADYDLPSCIGSWETTEHGAFTVAQRPND